MKQFVCLTLLMTTPVAACAATLAADDIDFAVSLGKTKTEFTYADTGVVNTRFEFIEVNWYERVYDSFYIGLHVGKTFLSQTGRSVTAGTDLDGTHVGVGIRAAFFQTSWIQPFVHATYLYRRVERDNGESVTLSWHEPQIRLGVTTAPWGPLRVYGGANWTSVDGSERHRGTVSSTTDFERDGSVSGFLGVDLTVDTTGAVGVEAYSGDVGNGIEIYFKRRY